MARKPFEVLNALEVPAVDDAHLGALSKGGFGRTGRFCILTRDSWKAKRIRWDSGYDSQTERMLPREVLGSLYADAGRGRGEVPAMAVVLLIYSTEEASGGEAVPWCFVPKTPRCQCCQRH